MRNGPGCPVNPGLLLQSANTLITVLGVCGQVAEGSVLFAAGISVMVATYLNDPAKLPGLMQPSNPRSRPVRYRGLVRRGNGFRGVRLVQLGVGALRARVKSGQVLMDARRAESAAVHAGGDAEGAAEGASHGVCGAEAGPSCDRFLTVISGR